MPPMATAPAANPRDRLSWAWWRQGRSRCGSRARM